MPKENKQIKTERDNIGCPSFIFRNRSGLMDNEIVKTTPPVGVSALSLMGIPLSDWVYIVTIVYVLIQIYVLLYKTFYSKKD